MQIDIITLFPEFFEPVFKSSIIGRGQESGAVSIRVHQLRDWAIDRHGTVDSRPFGGGAGMVLRPEPLFGAVETIKEKYGEGRVIFLTPQGATFSQDRARKLATEGHLIFICGHYEGVDQRVRDQLVDEEISIGNYVLTGGEIPAMVVVDAIVRLLPGVLAEEGAVDQDSFSLEDSQGRPLLEYPQYTRPAEFRGLKVPDVLLSGNHAEIAKWRSSKSQLSS